MEQLTKNKIKDLNRNKLYQNNPEVNKMVTQEQITLQNLINEFENKINEKENQLSVNKEKIKQSLLELQNRPLIQKNNINKMELEENKPAEGAQVKEAENGDKNNRNNNFFGTIVDVAEIMRKYAAQENALNQNNNQTSNTPENNLENNNVVKDIHDKSKN